MIEQDIIHLLSVNWFIKEIHDSYHTPFLPVLVFTWEHLIDQQEIN